MNIYGIEGVKYGVSFGTAPSPLLLPFVGLQAADQMSRTRSEPEGGTTPA